jgi:hypothetical protein
MFKDSKVYPVRVYPVSKRIFLNLKYEDVKRAKSYSCMWDAQRNKWYFHKDDYLKSGIKYNEKLHSELCPYMIINSEILYV